MTITRIDLLRHGLPEGDDCFRGHADFLLTEKGFAQMYASVGENADYDLVVTSPLKRCRKFANEYAAKNGIQVVEEPDFMELDFGDWDGMSKQEVWEYDQKALSDFWSKPWETVPPNGESLEDYEVRVLRAWSGMLDVYKGRKILLVTHGGVIKQMIRVLLDMPKSEVYLQRINIPYAAKVGVSVYHDENGKRWPELLWPVA
ncbi:histidine phosphatase family protein [Vibrio sp. JC009]|uniref:histidine phosphatase family protein n=1 Tax=Vibrio sp. JC009 TaxID=2912314 RepID=UPI0023B20659|nr:histidine phosphatase family protein [Vibrio sp. JC009]WED24586.1 histidine phosphatase family protein [Vibrio sp. JC009]